MDRILASASALPVRPSRAPPSGGGPLDAVVVRRGTETTGDVGLCVVVSLTEAGVERLSETAPIHARGIAKLFVAQLDDAELEALRGALEKVTLDCTFG